MDNYVNIYNNLSTINCDTVSFSVLGEKMSIVETPIIFSNGIRAITHECLKNCLSFNTNNKTALFLSDLTKPSNIFTEGLEPAEIGLLTEIDSPLLNKEEAIITPLASHVFEILKLKPYGNSSYVWFSSGDKSFNSDDVFEFKFQPDRTVVIESLKTKYLLTSNTPQFLGDGGLTFEPRKYTRLSAEDVYIDNQRFDYSLGPDNISLFQIADYVGYPRFQNVVTKLASGNYGLSSLYYLTSADKFPKEASLSFLSYKEMPTLNLSIKDSFLAKYEVNPNNDQQTLTLDLSTLNQEYTQNYLGIIPFEYPIRYSNGVKYPLAIHGLKNYQTPEYNYSFGVDYINNQKGVRRVYENIYSGTNQLNGLDHIYLGFKSNTLETNFESDKDTPFYFNPTSERMPLSSAGLIEDGAIASEHPFISDRIYIKLQDYSEKIPNSSQPPSIKKYSNTWLCSWLSGSTDGNKTWMDRYYNPAFYSINQALSAKVLLYNDRLDPNKDYTFDIPSEMYLEPGALYRYFHVGKQNRLNFINHLSSNSILQITKWDSSPLIDESPNKNHGILYYNSANNLKTDYLILDGKNHVLFPATSELLTQSKLTVSMWVNVKDWNRVEGTQIFGNYYDSGFGLINDSSLTTPIITIVDSASSTSHQSKIYNLNYKFANLESIKINNENFIGNKIIQKLPNYSYWVFDTLGLCGIKYDINNNVLVKTKDNVITSSNLKLLKQISQVEIDSNENLYIYDNITKNYICINTFGEYLSDKSGEVSKNTNRIEIDLEDKLISCFGDVATIDNDNSLWEVVGGNLYKNKAIFGNLGYVQQITVDADNYLWVLSSQDTVSKINPRNNEILFSRRIGKYSTLPQNPCIDYTKKFRFMNFVRVPRDINSNQCSITNTASTEDRAIIVDLNDNQIYTLNGNGDVITKLNLLGLTENINSNMLSYGDFTGYQYLRKYTSIVKKISWKLKISTPNGKNPKGETEKLLILPYNITNLKSGWQHFSLVFDSTKGTAKAYLNSSLIHEVNFTPEIYQLYYDYRTSLLLGCETIQNTTLNDIIGIDDGYKFIGEVSELRVYSKALTKGEMEQIYFSSNFSADDRTLLWNMSVGERNYIEQIKHWFKLQLPGSKSKYYNINIHNLNVPDTVKEVIESGIKNNLEKIAPANTTLYKINWL